MGHIGIGHDGRRIGVDEDDLVALVFERLACLGSGVVELAGLANDDGSGAEDHDFLDVGALSLFGGGGRVGGRVSSGDGEGEAAGAARSGVRDCG